MIQNQPDKGGQMQVPSLDWEDPLEEEMTSHSSILAWRIPWTEKPGGLQSWGHKKSDTTDTLSMHSQRPCPEKISEEPD